MGAAQAPEPLQCDSGVKVEPLQVAAAQLTLGLASVQVPPVQVPVLPQVPFGAQLLWASVVPSGTTKQPPAWPETLQAWQVGQLALPQQTPSRQLPEEHSWFVVQATPFDLTDRQAPFVPVQ